MINERNTVLDMKWCPKCQKRGFADSETKCPTCGGTLWTQVTLSAASQNGERRSRNEPTRETRQEPIREATTRETRQEPIREAAARERDNIRQEPIREPVRDDGRANGGRRRGTISRDGVWSRVRRHRADPMLIMRLCIGVILGIALLCTVAWLIENREAVGECLACFGAGFMIGCGLCIVRMRQVSSATTVVGIGTLCGVIAVILGYNLFDITATIESILVPLGTCAIIFGAIVYILTGGRRR